MRKITVIPSTINPQTRAPFNEIKKRKVAAYARVSTESDEQLTSYEAQIDYYTTFIKNNPEWEFIKVYSDEGISATNTRNREGFKQMISDALHGKIDLIITKSISRFARNTVDTLVAIRKLKEKGVECFFEKENIYTFDSKGELLLTIMSSLAQEESRSLSQNVTWGIRKSFSDGKVKIAYKQFLGYKRGLDGRPEIVPEEAETIKRIYYLFLSGRSTTEIKRILETEQVKAPGGGLLWHQNTIRSILTNEKYKGDALLQKRFTVDFLEKKSKVNEGEVPQYYVENSHEAIIPVEEWNMVQEELKARNRIGASFKGRQIFDNRLVCADCGGFYGPKVWHSNSKYRRKIWQCNHKFTNGHKCKTPHLSEEQLQNAFIIAYNQLKSEKDRVINHCKEFIVILDNTATLDQDINALNAEIDILDSNAKAMVTNNASSEQDQTLYRKEFANLELRYNAAQLKLVELQEEKNRRIAQISEIKAFMTAYIKQPDALKKWSEVIWNEMIDKVIIYQNKSLKFIFKNSSEVKGVIYKIP